MAWPTTRDLETAKAHAEANAEQRRKIYSIHRDAMPMLFQIFAIGIGVGMLLTIAAITAAARLGALP